MSHMGHIEDINDETPLLQANDTSRKPTLLPTSQVLVICSERLCDIVTLSSISPYINQVREMLLARYAAHPGDIAIS